MLIEDQDDPLMALHRRTGRELAEEAFTLWQVSATEAMLFSLERVIHPRADEFMTKFDANDDQKLLAKLILGSSLRAHYRSLCERHGQDTARIGRN